MRIPAVKTTKCLSSSDYHRSLCMLAAAFVHYGSHLGPLAGIDAGRIATQHRDSMRFDFPCSLLLFRDSSAQDESGTLFCAQGINHYSSACGLLNWSLSLYDRPFWCFDSWLYCLLLGRTHTLVVYSDPYPLFADCTIFVLAI